MPRWITVALVAVLAAAAAASSPLLIGHYVQSSEVSTTAANDENLLIAGMDAAIAEQNAKGGVHGRPLELIFPDPTEANVTRRIEEFTAHVAANASAVASNSYLTATALPALAAVSDVPIVSPYTDDAAFTASSGGAQSRQVFHIRQSFESEIRHLVNYAIRGHRRCFSIALTTANISGYAEAFAAVTADLASIGYPAPVRIDMDLNEPGASSYAKILAAITSSTQVNLTCVLMLTGPKTIHDTILQFNQNPDFRNVDAAGAAVDPRRELYFFTTSYTHPWEFHTTATDVPPSSSVPFRFLYLAQSFPSTTGDFIAAQRCRGALTALYANTSLKSTPNGIAAPYFLPTYNDSLSQSSIMGYLTVRFVIDLLSRTTNMTNEGILTAAYATRTFVLDDFVLGPYTDGCVGQETSATGACRCNRGTRRIFTTSIGPRGFPVTLADNAGAFERGVATTTIPLSRCSVASAFDRPISQALVLHGSTTTVSEQRLLMAWAWWLVDHLATFDTEVLPLERTVSASSIETEVQALSQRYRIQALIANTAPNVKSLQAFKIGHFTDALPEQDKPYGPFADYDPLDWRINPVLADTIHTAMSYAASLGVIHRVGIAVDTASALELARRSLVSFGGNDFAAQAVIKPGTPDLFITTAGPAVLIIASQQEQIIRAAERFAIHSVNIPNSPIVVLAGSEYRLERNIDPTAGSPAVFVSGLAQYPAGFNASGAYGVLYGRTLRSVTNIQPASATGAGQTQSFQSRADALFRTGSVVAGQTVLTPLTRDDCGLTQNVWPHPGGSTCQCSKGINTFYVRRVADWNSQTAAPVHTYRHAGCGVQYTVPIESSKSNTLYFIAGGAGLAVILIVVGVVVYLKFLQPSGRNNDNAPKDARQPFAMVFTDIQASTTLWARAPQHMGAGLDTHHETLRRLVARHKGYEVKTIGDSFMVAFKEVSPALQFALDIQSSLYDHDWGTALFDETYREMLALKEEATMSPTTADTGGYDESLWNGIRVRVGVHYGTGNIRQDETSLGYDYYGTVVNTAARVEGVGHGGQVLLTSDAMAALTDGGKSPVPPTIAVVEDLGLNPLRGLDEPVGLVQLLPPRFAGRTFPPLRLDKEIVVDDEGSSSDDAEGNLHGATPLESSDQTDNKSHISKVSKASAKDVTVEGLAKEVVRRTRSQVPHTAVLHLHCFLAHLFSTTSPADRANVVKGLADKWRVPTARWTRSYERHPKIGKEQVSLMNVIVRAVRTMETIDGAVADAADLTSHQHHDENRTSLTMQSAPNSPTSPRNALRGFAGSHPASPNLNSPLVAPVVVPSPESSTAAQPVDTLPVPLLKP